MIIYEKVPCVSKVIDKIKQTLADKRGGGGSGGWNPPFSGIF